MITLGRLRIRWWWKEWWECKERPWLRRYRYPHDWYEEDWPYIEVNFWSYCLGPLEIVWHARDSPWAKP